MFRKLLMSLTALALIACIVLTGSQFASIFSSFDDLIDVGDRFTKAEKRYTVTATADEECGHVEGVAKDYAKGDTATLIAVANDGYLFNGWYSNNGTCKATSPSYVFNVEKNTTVTARFVPAPEKTDGTFESATEYTSCSEDFTFSVFCNEENAESIIAGAIKIVDADLLGTEYEELGTVTPVITHLVGGEFSVSPSGNYRRGTTYTAQISSPSVSLRGGASSITFTIEGDKSSNASYSDGIVNLDKATITVTDDYIITAYPLAKDDIVCLYEELDENNDPVLSSSTFIKITSVEGEKAYYTTPDLDNVYKELDLYYKEKLNPTESGLKTSSELEKQLYSALLSDEAFVYTVAHAQQALADSAARNGYTVELMTEENIFDSIQIDARSEINGSTIKLDITVNCRTPILDKNGNTLAVFVLRFDIDESIELTPSMSLRFRQVGDDRIVSYNVGVRTDITEDSKISFSFDYNGNSTIDALKNDFNSELKLASSNGKPVFEKIKETLKNSAYSTDYDAEISIFESSDEPIDLGYFKMDLDLKFNLALDAAAALEYSSHTEQYFETGVRSSSNGPQYYEARGMSASCSDIIIAGKANLKLGISLDTDFTLYGLDNLFRIGFEADCGSYSDIVGFANVKNGSAAAYMEFGTYQKLDCAYSIMMSYTKQFSGSEEQKTPALKFGYKNAILGYMNSDSIEKNTEIHIIDKETDISSLPLLALSKLDIEKMSMSEERLNPRSGDYTVQIKLGANSNLSYSDGKIQVKDTAPAFFKETVTITVKPSSAKWSKYEDGRVYTDVTQITVTIVFGDEDAYYDSIDTNIQKQFRRIYRSYNKANADVLRDGFEEMIESFVEIPESSTALYHDFTAEYLGQLFDLIEEYRAKDDDKRTMENKFVASEAGIFDSAVTLIYEIADGKDIEEDREKIYGLLEQADDTVALYNTLIAVQDSEALKKELSDIGPKTKAQIEKEISDYESAVRADGEYTEKTENLIKAVRNLFSIEESSNTNQI